MQAIITDEFKLIKKATGEEVLIWFGFNELELVGYTSLPSFVENNSNDLRSEILSLLDDAAASSISKNLEIRSGLSLIVPLISSIKNVYENDAPITLALYSLAAHKWFREKNISHIKYVGNNQKINSVLKLISEELQIIYLSSCKNTKFNIKDSKYYIQLYGIAWLSKYLIERCSIKLRKNLPQPLTESNEIIFFTYLFNGQISEGKFVSEYWGNLPDTLIKMGIKTKWVYIYVKSKNIPNFKIAKKIIGNLNLNFNEEHELLDQNLSINVIVRTLINYIKIIYLCRKNDYKKIFVGLHDKLLSEIFKRKLLVGIYGEESFRMLLHLNLIEESLKKIQKESCIYLKENLSWEFLLINTWNRLTTRPLVGFQHSFLRYWDLKYFFNSESYKTQDQSRPTLPDLVAVNGPKSRMEFLNAGLPVNKIIDVEDLRYQSNMLNSEQASEYCMDQKGDKIKLLVLGDCVPDLFKKQIYMISHALSDINSSIYQVYIKPHPLLENYITPHELNDFILISANIHKATDDCDAVFVSSITSAAMPAYSRGLPVICMLDGKTLNLSPLRGRENVFNISSVVELNKILKSLPKKTKATPMNDFSQDNSLPKWRALIDKIKDCNVS